VQNSLPSPAKAATPAIEPAKPIILPEGKQKIDLLFDSGAFSAWRLGKPVDLDEYCAYLHANKQWMTAYFSLDVINPNNPEEAARQSFENYKYMRKQGLDPIPVLHAQEDIRWLVKMLDEGAGYIALAARSLGTSFSHINDWYSQCWNYLTDSAGRPLVRVHALGEGRLDTWGLFPWWSVDSTSWIYTAQRNAQIPLGDGKVVSHRNDGLSLAARPDIQSMSLADTHAFEKHLAKYGVDRSAFYDRTPDSNVICTYLALQFYMEQERKVTASCPIAHKPHGLLRGKAIECIADRDPLDIRQLRYYPVIGNNHIAWATIAFVPAERGLISYFYVASNTNTNQKSYRSNYYGNLVDFLYEPGRVCSSINPMKKAWDILDQYIKRK
jgi:hypothetical protein